VESQGKIQDRTREHLGTADKAIVAFRQLLLEQIRKAGSGERTLLQLAAAEAAAVTGPGTMDGIGPADEWQAYWQGVDQTRRSRAPWRAQPREGAA
jgi:hypothetical protein